MTTPGISMGKDKSRWQDQVASARELHRLGKLPKIPEEKQANILYMQGVDIVYTFSKMDLHSVESYERLILSACEEEMDKDRPGWITTFYSAKLYFREVIEGKDPILVEMNTKKRQRIEFAVVGSPKITPYEPTYSSVQSKLEEVLQGNVSPTLGKGAKLVKMIVCLRSER